MAEAVLLFIFGAAIGSFLNVVALRYGGEKFLFDPKVIGGRSHCPRCRRTLRWFELIPIISFIIQGGRCRRCQKRIGAQYPIVEILSGAIFAAVPFFSPHLLSALWIFIFEILLLLSYIDILLGIIPDELNVVLLVFGFLEVLLLAGNSGAEAVWLNHIAAALFGVLFFGGLAAVTRGKGMGMGDVKLALPLGLIFGWPGILMLTAFAFIVGAAFGLAAIAAHSKTMKSAVPFAPFLAASSAITFFWGSALSGWYLRVIGL